MTTALDILTKARSLIADEKNWIKGDAARTASGKSRPVRAEDATCFCMAGALDRAAGDLSVDLTCLIACDAYMLVCRALPGSFSKLSIFNDDIHTSHSHVVGCFDLAIAEASI